VSGLDTELVFPSIHFMPDLFQLLQRRGRFLVVILIGSWLVTASVLWLMPPLYKSESTSVASSVVAADPARLFNPQIQHLYSPLGSSDQLDLLVGSGKLDTVYRPLVRRFNLIDHYSIAGDGQKTFQKAVNKLKKRSEVYKSDQGELKVRVWDQDPVFAAAMANALTAQLDSLHRDLLNRQNQETWSALQRASLRLEALRDSMSGDYAHQQGVYRQLIDQYALLLEQQPPAIHILDPATVSVSPDKPEWILILVAATAVALLVGLLIALWMERRTDYAVAP